MTFRRLALPLMACLAAFAPAAEAQRWVEVTGPHVTVVSDAGAGRARDIAWQFQQIREALVRTFPWIRSTPSKPLVVVAARNPTSMRMLVPGLWSDGREGELYASSSSVGRDHQYIVVRADIRNEDREGVSPYQSVYWSYAAQALNDTSRALPQWLVRGLAELLSNTLVREKEIQVGRTLPQNLSHLRSRPRLALKDIVATATSADLQSRLGGQTTLTGFDAQAWALVHFLIWGEKGVHAPSLSTYISGVLSGADPVASIPSTLGDVARLESAMNVYIGRDVFFYASFATAATVTRDGLTVRDLPDVEVAVLRAKLHVAMDRLDDARRVVAEAGKLGTADAGAEVTALLADEANDATALRDALERAVTEQGVSWWAPYRLATLLPTGQGRTVLDRIATLLEQATAANPNADGAWAYRGEVLAALGRPEEAVAASEKAITLLPSSSGHRLSLARVYLRLGRFPDGLKAAGIGRAMARTQAERDEAQQVLAELARAMAPPKPGR